MKYFDLKVGYACNNHCIHCAIEGNRLMLEKEKSPINHSFDEIKNMMTTEEFISADSVTITGGEPTLRNDFLDILKLISTNYPEKEISIQTNGVLLEQYIVPISQLKSRIFYTISFHGPKEIHNRIVRGDFYDKTLSTILKARKFYGEFSPNMFNIRSVLSQINYLEIPNFLKFLISKDLSSFSITYPHLIGFYHLNRDLIRSIGFSYKDLLPTMIQYINIAKDNPTCHFSFEEFPICMFRDENDNFITIPENMQIVNNLMMSASQYTSIKYPSDDITSSLDNYGYIEMHRKPHLCKYCVQTEKCPGIWEEAFKTFGGEGLKAIEV